MSLKKKLKPTSFLAFQISICNFLKKMSDSSSTSDSEASSSDDDAPKVTTHTERVIRRYQIKKSLILERLFAINQVSYYIRT